MTPDSLVALETTFNQLVEALLQQRQTDEHLILHLTAEQSQFTRFNQAKVRQTGLVRDGNLSLTLMRDQRTGSYEIPFTGEKGTDWPRLQMALEALRQELPQLPIDPFLVLPSGEAQSHSVHAGSLLTPEAIASTVLPLVQGLDFAGLYAGGWVIRAYADSVGQRHWFATETFALDYSLFAPSGQAVKDTVAGSVWDTSAYTSKIQAAKRQLERLTATPPKVLERGQYRTYLAPAAVADLIGMFSWGAVSEGAMQRGGSALGLLQRGEKQLSPQFTLMENFQRGVVPQFNDLGELPPITLPIVEAGQLKNTLISARTAKEYSKIANGAASGEYLRSPEVKPGTLSAVDLLHTLDTGLYVSNLHYLNWSDRPNGRITGMTRYACFWVENGEWVAPIENLRFDESLYRCFGDRLIHLTAFQEFIPHVGTYGSRELGGTWVPGMLMEEFTYTL
ncbi:TldD/PmbA family protein [Stenomitos frigidus]|uniref:Zn-dependent protease n=1 Tax=Stenomitos frigidus ULC18 TaxID=2107698 RepID=A0A2T1ER84_9CYAN|nr:metallopeptidase TldD-related protein [Stenomitos frigidus]PSB35256.1 Zn-dependent protease [Stenomitos frigidus ULC18]